MKLVAALPARQPDQQQTKKRTGHADGTQDRNGRFQADVLEQPEISDLISELAANERLVIIDAPPLNPVADAQVLLNSPAINATLIVARLETTTRDEVRRAP